LHQINYTISVAAVPDFQILKKLIKYLAYSWEKDDENPYHGSVELFKKLFFKQNLIFTTFT
jgi:hypothetical protein